MEQGTLQESTLEVKHPSVFSVDWDENEKEQLTLALNRYGKTNIKAIASEIPTKNRFQIELYIITLEYAKRLLLPNDNDNKYVSEDTPISSSQIQEEILKDKQPSEFPQTTEAPDEALKDEELKALAELRQEFREIKKQQSKISKETRKKLKDRKYPTILLHTQHAVSRLKEWRRKWSEKEHTLGSESSERKKLGDQASEKETGSEIVDDETQSLVNPSNDEDEDGEEKEEDEEEGEATRSAKNEKSKEDVLLDRFTMEQAYLYINEWLSEVIPYVADFAVERHSTFSSNTKSRPTVTAGDVTAVLDSLYPEILPVETPSPMWKRVKCVKSVKRERDESKDEEQVPLVRKTKKIKN